MATTCLLELSYEEISVSSISPSSFLALIIGLFGSKSWKMLKGTLLFSDRNLEQNLSF